MAHATPEGLAQEEGALNISATARLTDLQERGITAEFLTMYAARLQNMKDALTAHIGKTSDKEQLTAGEITAKNELLADVRRIQQGAKRTFPKESPQLKEFHVGEKYNRSTSLLSLWATDIAAAWTKYKADLTGKGKLLQKDVDTMVANNSILTNADATQESAKHIESPEATAAALRAMAEVEDAADAIYAAAEAEYAKNPQVLGEFEKLKPLRYAVERSPKLPTPPPDDTAKN